MLAADDLAARKEWYALVSSSVRDAVMAARRPYPLACGARYLALLERRVKQPSTTAATSLILISSSKGIRSFGNAQSGFVPRRRGHRLARC
jgi:hypothetical protein